ncbi:TrbC/VirB2 family protein [Microvirga alba]|uniref:TrbC/VirB2 family protein n=1 Tax=Microvirga alba TaxID=2791025 RepID=A0A931BQH7_9HYPH|nr:TrbC/VirB2 family protein [Microvirga alba]MBF9235606.1 TrbC/VirB2 family protein [Microvirga alba]
MKKQTIVTAALIAAGASLVMMEPAFAQAGGGLNLEGFLQNILSMLTGTVAKLLATIALIVIGIAWLFLGMDKRVAGTWVVAVMIIFGAPQILNMIVGS